MSEKRQTKAMQDRHERILNELLKVPGNEYCADCRSKNPRWASYSLGVFLCVRCAGIHRKMGTHISRIKSLSMDQWTVEQIDSIKNGGGNIKVNNIVNPNPSKYPLPLADDEGHAMEKYIRNKWEKRAFMEKPTLGPSLAMVPSGIQQQSRPRNVPQRSSSVPAIMSENDGIALSKLREMGFKDDYKNQTVLRQTQGNINAAVEILSRQNPPILSSSSSPRDTQNSLSDDQKLVQLRNMGYTDMTANRDALRRTGGNVDVAVTVLKSQSLLPKGPATTTTVATVATSLQQQTNGAMLLDLNDPPTVQTPVSNSMTPFQFQQQQQYNMQSQQQPFMMQSQQQQPFMTQSPQQPFAVQSQQQQFTTQPQQQQQFTTQPQQQQQFTTQPQQQQQFMTQLQQQPFTAQSQVQYSIPQQQQQYTLQPSNQSSPFSISSASDPFGQNALTAPVQSTSLQTNLFSPANNSNGFANTQLTLQQQPMVSSSSNPFSNPSGLQQQPLTPSASSPFTNYFAQQPQQQQPQQTTQLFQHPHSFPQQQFSHSSFF